VTGVEETLHSISLALARFSGFAANALIFGMVPIVLLVLRPAFAQAPEGWDEGRRRVSNRLEWLMQACLVASFAATALVLILQVVLLAELEGGELRWSQVGSVLETNFGRWFGLRFPLLAGLGVLLWGRIRHASLAGAGDEQRPPASLWWGAWAALGLALLATTSFSGHAAVAHPRAVALTNDVVHLSSGATWFAGVVVLAAVIPDAWLGRPEKERLQVLAPVVSRFSRVALASIIVVAATGTANSFLNVASPGDLIDSGYGRVLATKILLFLGILFFGATNRFVVRRRLGDAVSTGEPGAVQRLFRRAIAAELVIALGVMGTTGVLVGQARTRETTAPVGESGQN
jgi:putative copper export protein